MEVEESFLDASRSELAVCNTAQTLHLSTITEYFINVLLS